MKASSMPSIPKAKPIRKTHTTRRLPSATHILTDNFHRFLRDTAYPNHPRPTNPLITFLNLSKAQPETSLHYIPSIENMMSQQNIEEGPADSLSSI